MPAIDICVAHRREVFLRRLVALPYFLLVRRTSEGGGTWFIQKNLCRSGLLAMNAVVKSYEIGGPLSLAQCNYRSLLTQNLSLE